MAIANKRIIDLETEITNLSDDTYLMVDSDTNGTAKYKAKKFQEMAESAATAVEAEATARQAADDALQTAIDAKATPADITAAVAAEATARDEAIAAEATARTEAIAVETAAREADVADLKEDLTAEETARANAVSAEATAREAADDAINTALETKANVNGYYQEMTVGDAEQLVSTQFIENSVPYLYRTSGGSADIGNREYDEIVGGSVVWNSLARFNQSDIPPASNGITYAYTDGNSVLINGTATANETRTGWFGLTETAGLDFTRLNHKVLIYPKLISGTVEGSVSFLLPSNTSAALDTAKIGVLAYSNTNQIRGIHSITNGTVCTNAKITIICIDLTAKFGSAIADYLYTLDSATAGAGIEKLKSWGYQIDEYHEYNTGDMEHVSGISAHETVGFNQWDEEWEVGTINTEGNNANSTSNIRSKNYIPCLPNTSYYGNFPTVTGSSSLFFYDGDENFLSRTTFSQGFAFITPESAKFMRFAMGSSYGTTYKNDICINLHWSGTRDGEYEPYVKHTYALDDSVTLRGIPKLDENNQLYYDGDTYAADGTVTRKYGIVTLNGSSQENWVKSSSYPGGYYWGEWVNEHSINGSINHVQNNNLATITGGIAEYSQKTNVVYFDGSLNIKLNQEMYPTIESFRNYLQTTPVTIVYELKTPTTETATPYRSLQKVDPYGTEEYVSTSLVPVGHYTKYPENLRAKIENLDLSMIAPIEKGTTASQAYAVGKYFLLNNKFCKAKTAIASGATFTLNTNYEVTTIADELYTALNA